MSNTNVNEHNIIIIKPNVGNSIPYFKAMRSFYNIAPNANMVIERNTSGFSSNEFNTLKNIVETGTTPKYKYAEFFQNYLGLNKNAYNPTVNMPEPILRKKGYYVRMPGKKDRQRTRKAATKFNNNDWNLYEPSRKEQLKAVEMAERQSERENVAALVENVLGPNRVNMVVSVNEKAMRSKYPKSKRPSRTSRKTEEHEENKVIRTIVRNKNRTRKAQRHVPNSQGYLSNY
jgi:hypothetical protein